MNCCFTIFYQTIQYNYKQKRATFIDDSNLSIIPNVQMNTIEEHKDCFVTTSHKGQTENPSLSSLAILHPVVFLSL